MDRLLFFVDEITEELTDNILKFWTDKVLDFDFGGFYGSVYNNNRVNRFANKSSLLNFRTLWSFAAAHNQTKKYSYLDVAHRAFNYNCNYFLDKENGGVYWEISYNGKPDDTRKFLIANAAAILGFSEYFLATGEQEALNEAIKIFRKLDEKAHDSIHGGYHEAYLYNWEEQEVPLFRSITADASKSMDSHLHLLEAYTNLYKGWQNIDLKKRIKELFDILTGKCYNKCRNSLSLYFTDDWEAVSGNISYGHNIEAVSILNKASSVYCNRFYNDRINEIILKLAYKTVKNGIAGDGSVIALINEDGHPDTDKYWWHQLEAMSGFITAYHITNDALFYDNCLRVWEYCKRHFSAENGEWYAVINKSCMPLNCEDKIGKWKSSYHAVRALTELLKRLR